MAQTKAPKKRVLNAETREKLAGLLPFCSKTTFDYTPAPLKGEGIPEEFRPVFKLRTFSKGEHKDIQGLVTDAKNQDEEAFIDAVRKITMGWTNFIDLGTLEEIEYVADPAGGADPEVFNRMSPLIISDMLFEALKLSGLVDAQKVGLKS